MARLKAIYDEGSDTDCEINVDGLRNTSTFADTEFSYVGSVYIEGQEDSDSVLIKKDDNSFYYVNSGIAEKSIKLVDIAL